MFPEILKYAMKGKSNFNYGLPMPKVIPIDFENSEIEELKAALDKKCLSYILITCTPPSAEGNMDVEMVSEGDPALLAMLLEGATERLGYS